MATIIASGAWAIYGPLRANAPSFLNVFESCYDDEMPRLAIHAACSQPRRRHDSKDNL